MRSLFILAFFCLVGWSYSQKCPARYLRFTPVHSFCLPPNPTCEIKRTGVSEVDKKLILKLHNQFRSKVAMGNEHGSLGGSLPQAADMLQMEWDDELAAVAQKWTENCKWGHDCKECRAVENFAVGQNLVIQDWSPCYGYGCKEPSNDPQWTQALTALYNEVNDYNVNWLGSYEKHDEPKKTGHLTQLIWSRSWRVGCGYSYYKQAGGYHLYYACNYGPGGNIIGEPVYKPGRPCSACPTNTQCSTVGRGANSFAGLCKMTDPNTTPAYPRSSRSIFLCDFTSTDSDCEAEGFGQGRWSVVRSVGGNYKSIVLNGGQSTSFTLTTPITPNADAFCLAITFRKGPLDATYRDESIFKADFKMDYASVNPIQLQLDTTNFMQYKLNLRWRIKTKVGFTFSVPRGAGKHVLDIRRIEAFDGMCN
ncbi:CRISP/Allergen/PR-1 like protein [Argiope bruennichi]|uniref:CRISP/Allergen/PR-1 like protein n=1 Tax=Argiope bruennichi TaxID=94029 RepID=A0A8T0E4K2_ARGBR|nr:CRISP/Allergen/PR-1 like protein [Argiope bruennichi]